MKKQDIAKRIKDKFRGCGFNFTIQGINDEESRYLHTIFTLSDKYILTTQSDTDYEDKDGDRLLYGITIANNNKNNPDWIHCSLDIWSDTELLDFLANWESHHKAAFEKMATQHQALEMGIEAINEKQDNLRRTFAKSVRNFKSEDKSIEDE